MTKILITGGSGFVGKNLVFKLQSAGCSVKVVVHSDGDIARRNTWAKFEPSDVVIHLAALTFVPESWTSPIKFMETNLQGTLQALDYCRQNNCRLIYISSFLYGDNGTNPISESAPLVPTNPYALSKKFSEDACKFYAEFYDVKTIILRPFNIFGQGQSDKFLIPAVVKQILAGNIILVNDLSPRRDYIYVEDVVDAIKKAVFFRTRFEILNIGSGESHSVSEVINVIQTILGSSCDVREVGGPRKAEIGDSKACIERTKNLLGWAPKFRLRQGLEDMFRRSEIIS